jgi:hypothetical protein
MAHPKGARGLAGSRLILTYVDANGAKTTRGVRVIRYQDDVSPALYCFCEMRKGERTFLLERIEEVVDEDGVVEEPQDFFARFGIEVPAPLEVPATSRKDTTSMAAEARTARDEQEVKRPGRVGARGMLAIAVALFGALLLASGGPAPLFGFLSLVGIVLIPLAAIWPAIILPRSPKRLKAVLVAAALLVGTIVMGAAVT